MNKEKATVLVADDDEDIRLALEMLLVSEGYLVINYTEGEVLFPLPPFAGSVNKGVLTITNAGGEVAIN